MCKTVTQKTQINSKYQAILLELITFSHMLRYNLVYVCLCVHQCCDIRRLFSSPCVS